MDGADRGRRRPGSPRQDVEGCRGVVFACPLTGHIGKNHDKGGGYGIKCPCLRDIRGRRRTVMFLNCGAIFTYVFGGVAGAIPRREG
jgi:hypothetical protein